MEKPIAIGFARSGGFTAGGAAFGAATTAEPLAREPHVERRRATKNWFRQAVAITLSRRMIQSPSQKPVEMRFAMSAVGTIGWRRQRGSHCRYGGRRRQLGLNGRLAGHAQAARKNHHPDGQNTAYSHNDSPSFPKRQRRTLWR